MKLIAGLPRFRLSINSLMLLTALYLSLTQNLSFWKQVLRLMPADQGLQQAGLLICLFLTLNVLLLLVMSLLSARAIIKPALIVLIVIASVCSYFMDTFGTVIDQAMIVNAAQTDAREAGELLTIRMLVHILLFGFIPSLLLARVELRTGSLWQELLRRFLLVLIALAVLATGLFANYKDVSLWARANRDVRTYVNPTYPLYSLNRYLKSFYKDKKAVRKVEPIGLDAKRHVSASGKPRLLVMVVGETARAANFQLAGYARATNPELSGVENLVSFTQAWSCGTATVISVPCMFSRLGRSGFSRSKAGGEENLLDVLQRTGVSVLWRDNNSDSKGVSLRVPTKDFRSLKIDGLCNAEGCYDEALLDGLDDLISNGTTDQIVVLHLLGSHGPSYYKRYPPAFRRFTPDCAQDDVQSCSRESIINAYDNTMVYTDHVLAQLIKLLQRHQGQVQATMIYMSDHGESLGENGIYLHGLPYAIAPDEQKHIPFVFWSPDYRHECVKARAGLPYSHDNLFSTVLGIFQVETRLYQAEADILRGCAVTATPMESGTGP